MDNNRVDVTKQRMTLAVVGFVCFALVIIALSVVISFLTADNSNVSIANEKELAKSEDTSISSHDYSLIKKQIRDVVRDNYDLKDSEEVNVIIRESTYEEFGDDKNKTISFIVDIENIKVTYNVWMTQSSSDASEVTLSCASAKDSKYPKSFCIGSEGYSSIDSTLAADLPYRVIINGEEFFSVTHEPYDPKLIIHIYAKCDDTATQNKAINQMKEWINSYGLDAEQVPVEKDSTSCSVYEDDLVNKSHDGHTQENMDAHL